jgi:hypothetical protein
MTDYYRVIRCDWLEDVSLSPDAFRILAYMLAQSEGFTFNLGHVQQVFRGVIGRDRIKAARAELIAGEWLTASPRRHDGGRLTQSGATVNRAKCLVDRRTEYQAPSIQAPSIQSDITNKNDLGMKDLGLASTNTTVRPGPDNYDPWKQTGSATASPESPVTSATAEAPGSYSTETSSSTGTSLTIPSPTGDDLDLYCPRRGCGELNVGGHQCQHKPQGWCPACNGPRCFIEVRKEHNRANR